MWLVMGAMTWIKDSYLLLGGNKTCFVVVKQFNFVEKNTDGS